MVIKTRIKLKKPEPPTGKSFKYDVCSPQQRYLYNQALENKQPTIWTYETLPAQLPNLARPYINGIPFKAKQDDISQATLDLVHQRNVAIRHFAPQEESHDFASNSGGSCDETPLIRARQNRQHRKAMS